VQREVNVVIRVKTQAVAARVAIGLIRRRQAEGAGVQQLDLRCRFHPLGLRKHTHAILVRTLVEDRADRLRARWRVDNVDRKTAIHVVDEVDLPSSSRY